MGKEGLIIDRGPAVTDAQWHLLLMLAEDWFDYVESGADEGLYDPEDPGPEDRYAYSELEYPSDDDREYDYYERS